MKNEMISIIVPMYNSEKTIKETIKSIQKQSYKNIEIILINDGSNDKTEIICKSFQKKDKRIKYYYQENKGEGGARNRGLENVTGKYIVFVDSDDKLPQDAIEVLYKHKDYPLVIGGIEKKEYGKRRYHIPKEEAVNDRSKIVDYVTDRWKMYYMNTVWAKLYRTNIILTKNIRFNDFKYGADTYFVYQYLKHIKRMYVVGKSVYRVMATENSMSLRKVENAWKIMKSLYEEGETLIEQNNIEQKYKLLDRSLKQTLILESRISLRSFRKTCEEMRSYLESRDIEVSECNLSSYQKLVFNGIIKHHIYILYFFFKTRRFICYVLKK